MAFGPVPGDGSECCGGDDGCSWGEVGQSVRVDDGAADGCAESDGDVKGCAEHAGGGFEHVVGGAVDPALDSGGEGGAGESPQGHDDGGA